MVGAVARWGLLPLVVVAALAWALAHPGRDAAACGAAGPFDFDTYEPEDYVPAYARAIELAAQGKAITFSFNAAGTNEPVDVRYQGLMKGARDKRVTTLDKNLTVPPSIFKSIAWTESGGWANASSSVPYGGVGPVLRSFDCGYGISQVTSGMSNGTGVASARQAVIGTSYLFNIAEGIRILADKWNSAPRYRPIAGTGDPSALEDWYFAVWSYNGFAFKNHPLNPNLDPLRGEVFHCWNSTAPGVGTFVRGDYTYPELVYGCMRYPPKANGQLMWAPVTFEAPKLSDELVAKAFDPKNFQACEDKDFATGCPEMDYPTTIEASKLTTHKDPTKLDPALTPAAMLGDPRLVYSGPPQLTLAANRDGTVTSGTVTVENVGKGIGPYRVRTSAPWLVVRHPNDASSRSLDGGVVIGKETEVVTQSANATRPRIAQPGYKSVLTITLDASKMPTGVSHGSVWIEPLLGSGGVFEVKVDATKAEPGLERRAVIPNVASSR